MPTAPPTCFSATFRAPPGTCGTATHDPIRIEVPAVAARTAILAAVHRFDPARRTQLLRHLINNMAGLRPGIRGHP